MGLSHRSFDAQHASGFGLRLAFGNLREYPGEIEQRGALFRFPKGYRAGAQKTLQFSSFEGLQPRKKGFCGIPGPALSVDCEQDGLISSMSPAADVLLSGDRIWSRRHNCCLDLANVSSYRPSTSDREATLKLVSRAFNSSNRRENSGDVWIASILWQLAKIEEGRRNLVESNGLLIV